MFRERLRDILSQEDINQMELAAELTRQLEPTGKKYSQAAVSFLLSGKNRPDTLRMLWLLEHGNGYVKRIAQAALDAEVERRR